MSSPITALIWELWARNRNLIWLVTGITAFACLFNSALPESFRSTGGDRFTFDAHAAIMMLNAQLAAVSVLLVLAIFSFTEFNRQEGSTGFPHRLFALPVTSLQLVAVPLFLGVAAIELVCLAWLKVVFVPDELTSWFAVLTGTYMVLYQTILWILPGLRVLRMIVLGLLANIFLFIVNLPRFPKGLSERSLIALFVGLALAGFLTAWIYVARQRSGEFLVAARRDSLKASVERLSDALHRRDKVFGSAAAAQFWFEWRRCGLVLPRLIAALLLVVIVPLSWYLRNAPGATLWILVWTLAMPLILAAAVGKAFSKADFWSSELSIPEFVAVRPMDEEEMVAIKLRVAALSTTIAWFLVLGFMSFWLPLWANIDRLNYGRLFVWQVYGHSLFPQYAIAALSVLAGALLTWRFLVGSLWLGLSGNSKLFMVSAAPYVVVPLFGLPVLAVLIRYNLSVLGWIRDNLDWLFSALVWATALAVAAKLWMAALSWRKISPQRVGQYLAVWIGGTLGLIALAMLLWTGLLRYFLPLDIYRVRSVLILTALLVIPFARLGFAPSSLARNRHR